MAVPVTLACDPAIGEFLTGEALMLGLLGRLIYAPPERDALQALLDADTFAEVPFAEGRPEIAEGLEHLRAWATECGGQITDHVIESLGWDHLRLFVGVGAVLAPPFESVYFNEQRLVFQAQTFQVREWYGRFGLELRKGRSEPDDHIGLELEFLSQLALHGVAATERQDEQALQSSLISQRAFLVEHPLAWAAHWCDLVELHAESDFYQGVVRLIRGALVELAARLAALVPGTSHEPVSVA